MKTVKSNNFIDKTRKTPKKSRKNFVESLDTFVTVCYNL